MSDLNLKLQVIVVPSSTNCEFWGKSCNEILLEEFKEFTEYYSDIKYIAYICWDCPLTDKAAILNLIKQMDGYSSIATDDNMIKIVLNGVDDNTKKIITAKNLNIQNNRDKIEINEILRRRIIDKHIDNGVFIINPQNTYIDFDVSIENGVTIYPNNIITGKTIIKSGCMLMPNNCINDTVLSENVTASASTFNDAFVGTNTVVGPNAYLRPKAKIGEDCKIGDFVEVKNAEIGNGTKVSHLAYVGDAKVGENCNIGCGVIFVNYNGKCKNISTVGNNCFIGSNCNIIAPVNIENEVFVAAGTTVTKDLPTDAFCIGRVREEIKQNFANKYLNK